MGEIRIVGPGTTRGYPYPVCKKRIVSPGKTRGHSYAVVSPGKTRGYPYPMCKKNRICRWSPMQTEKSQPEGLGFLDLHRRSMIDYFSYLLLNIIVLFP